jgi:hypothetical protein
VNRDESSGTAGPIKPLMARSRLIEQARRHQRRRRGVTGAILLAPIAVGGVVVGLSLGGANEQGRTLGTSASYAPQPHEVRVQHQQSRSTSETLSPSTAASVLASERAAAAIQAAEKAVDALAANIRSGQLSDLARTQEASQVAAAAAQEAAAAAPTQPGHR